MSSQRSHLMGDVLPVKGAVLAGEAITPAQQSNKRRRLDAKAVPPPYDDENATPSKTKDEQKSTKRLDYMCWDDYFMSVAMLSAMRSKDPSTQVGACIVNPEKKIVGIGYNGFPLGCSDDELPWARKAENELNTKYPYVCHAEMNAIMNKNCSDLKGCIMYVALFPCNECAKLIIQSGIRKVYYLSDKYHNLAPFIASRKLLDLAGVEYIQYTPKMKEVTISFNDI